MHFFKLEILLVFSKNSKSFIDIYYEKDFPKIDPLSPAALKHAESTKNLCKHKIWIIQYWKFLWENYRSVLEVNKKKSRCILYTERRRRQEARFVGVKDI